VECEDLERFEPPALAPGFLCLRVPAPGLTALEVNPRGDRPPEPTVVADADAG